MDSILMAYWVAVQVRTTMFSVMYKSKFRMRDTNLRRVLIIPCEMFLRYHLSNTRSIATIFNVRGRVDDIGYAL